RRAVADDFQPPRFRCEAGLDELLAFEGMRFGVAAADIAELLGLGQVARLSRRRFHEEGSVSPGAMAMVRMAGSSDDRACAERGQWKSIEKWPVVRGRKAGVAPHHGPGITGLDQALQPS